MPVISFCSPLKWSRFMKALCGWERPRSRFHKRHENAEFLKSPRRNYQVHAHRECGSDLHFFERGFIADHGSVTSGHELGHRGILGKRSTIFTRYRVWCGAVPIAWRQCEFLQKEKFGPRAITRSDAHLMEAVPYGYPFRSVRFGYSP